MDEKENMKTASLHTAFRERTRRFSRRVHLFLPHFLILPIGACFHSFLFLFHRNEVKLTKSPHIDLQRRKLHIKNASAKDNGVYSCLLVVVSRTDGSRRIALRSSKNYRLKLKPGTNYGTLVKRASEPVQG